MSPDPRGVFVPATTPLVRPWLARVAAVTVVAFTITSVLPAGWAVAAPARDTMRVRQAEPDGAPSPVAAGLEEALGHSVPSLSEEDVAQRVQISEERAVAAKAALPRRSFWSRAVHPVQRLTMTWAIALQLLGAHPTIAAARAAEPAAPHPGIVMNVVISGTNATAAATQTVTGRVLETPRDFARDPLRAAGQHLTDTVTAIRNRGRQAVFGSEDSRRWTAATTPARALLLPGTDVGYTVWHPEALGQLGPDRVNALDAAIGLGARQAGAHARFLWEVQYLATLKGADGKPHPSADVLRDVQRRLAAARQYGMDLWAMYSGTEGFGDPDVIVQLFQIAKDQGIHQFITDLEPWKEPGGAWARAVENLRVAEAVTDPTRRQKDVSAARWALLGEAGKWFAAHETLVQRVIQPDHAAPEGVAPALQALVSPAFVPFLHTAILWRQIDRAVTAQQAAHDPDRVEAARLAARQVFEMHTPENLSWDSVSLRKARQALTAAGYPLGADVFIPLLPDGLRLVVMAYDYPAKATPVQIARAVAAQMRRAAAGGFNTPLGLAINLEPGSVDPTLADRSAQAGEIAKAIVDQLRADPATGYDGTTLVVHVAGELDLVDLAKDGALSPARRVTPAQAQRAWRTLETAVKTLAGKTPMRDAEQHLIPIPRTTLGWWKMQARESTRGLATGIVGLEPGYANLIENPKQWFSGRPVVHLGSATAGPEGGVSVKGLRYLMGGLTSDQARIVGARLRLIKRSPDGRVIDERVVPSILGQDIPEISDAVWDEGELEITLRRDSTGSALPLGIAVRVANPHAGAGETPRDVWRAAAIAAGETTGTVTIPLPPITPHDNAITLLTHDEDGAIVEWIGPGQNPRYLTMAAPSVADRVTQRLKAARTLLDAIRARTQVPEGKRLTEAAIGALTPATWKAIQETPAVRDALKVLRDARWSTVFSTHDLIMAQALLETSALAAETAGRVEVLAWHTLATLTPTEVGRHLEELKRRNVTGVVVRPPDFERDLNAALTLLGDHGVSVAVQWFNRAPYTQMPTLSEAAHALGLKIYVVVETAPLLEQAAALEQAAQRGGRPRDALAGLVRLAMETSEQKWAIDGIALDHPVVDQRRQVERVLPGTFNLTMLTIGSDLTPSSRSSLGITPVTLGRDPDAVLKAARRAVDQPQPASPKKSRWPAGILLRVEESTAPLAATAAWLSDPARSPTAAADPSVLHQVLAGFRAPRRATLERLGYPDAVIREALTNAPTLTQPQLTEALTPDAAGAMKPWADALVNGLAAELRGISETSQLSRTGTPFQQAVAWLYGIQVTPLVVTEPPRVEITPLMTKHISQADGAAWLAVQVTNPADPAVATAPAVYDVELYMDYRSWSAPVRKIGTLTLMPGESVPVVFQVTGLPRHEDSRLVKVRVLPRSAEEHLPGQAVTRTPEQQSLEVAGFVIHRADGRPEGMARDFEDQMNDLRDHERRYRIVHGIKDPATMDSAERREYDKGYERRVRAWFGEGTPLQRADVTVVTETGKPPRLTVTLRVADPQTLAAQESARIRQVVEHRAAELLRWTRPVEDANGIRYRTWFYTIIGFIGFFGAMVGSVIGMIKGYRRAGAARRYREVLRETVERQASLPDAVSVVGEQMIHIEGIAAGLKTSPAMLNAEQGKMPTALSTYGKHWIGVVDVTAETDSQNIERTSVDPLRRADPDQATPMEQGAVFIRAAPRLLAGGVLAAVGGLAAAVVVGATMPLAWVLGPLAAALGVVVAAWTWTRRTADQQAAAGRWLMGPTRLGAGPIANHPVTVGMVGVAALAGAVAVGIAFHLAFLPWVAAATLTAVWFGVVANLADPGPGRLLGALGFSALGAVLLTGLWGATTPIWGGWVLLSIATGAIVQRMLMGWLTADRPMQGFLEGAWSAARFVVKWGTIAAVVYLAVAWVHPVVWGWMVSTVPLGIKLAAVGVVVGLNLASQVHLFWNHVRESGTARRDGWSLLVGGFGIPLGIAIAGLSWGWVPTFTVAAYLVAGISVLQGASLAMLGTAVVSEGVRAHFRGARIGPDELNLRPALEALQDSAEQRAALARYDEARAAAAADTLLQRQYKIDGPFLQPAGAPVPDAQLTPRHWLLINRHYWRLTATEQAQRQSGFDWLSPQDQYRLIDHYFTEHLKAHTDIVIGQDDGTTMRMFGRAFVRGLWTGDLDEVVTLLRTRDDLTAVMPALILSLRWSPGEAWARVDRHHPATWILIPWEMFRMALVSFAVPLGFTASMVNRTVRALTTHGATLANPLRVRADAGIAGYREPIEYVTKVMGRWLVGHVFIVMRAYLGRRVTRSAEDLLLTHRWGRKDGTVHARIDRLSEAADRAWTAGDDLEYRRLMGPALYAALVGDKTQFFDVGQREVPEAFEQEPWNQAPDSDGLFDEAYFGEAFTAGRLGGTVAQRYDRGALDGVHIYYPTHVERVRTCVTGLGDAAVRIERLADEQTLRVRVPGRGGLDGQTVQIQRLTVDEQQQLNTWLAASGVKPPAQVLEERFTALAKQRSRLQREQRTAAWQAEKTTWLRQALAAAESGRGMRGPMWLRWMFVATPAQLARRLEKVAQRSAASGRPVATIERELETTIRRLALRRKIRQLPNGQWAYYRADGAAMLNGVPIPDASFGAWTQQLAPEPGKFLIRMPYEQNPKSRLADTALQYFQGRLTPEAEISVPPSAGLEERARLRIRFVDEERRAFPEIERARQIIHNPRDWFAGARRTEGVAAADAMAARMHEQALGASLGSETDVTALAQVELGHDAYRTREGQWYQRRLGFFRWLRDRYLGRDRDGRPNSRLAFTWWAGLLALAGVAVRLGSPGLAIGLFVVPWLLSMLYGTLTAVSFFGMGIQDTVLQGMKGHYDGQFLQQAMDDFFQGTPAADRRAVSASGYDDRLMRGHLLLNSNPQLPILVEAYARAMHPGDDWYRAFRTQRADPELVRRVRTIIRGAPATRWGLRTALQRAIVDRLRAAAGADADRWLDAREAMTRWLQLELAAVGNEVGGIQYHRSHDRDVFRSGDENRNLGVDGQEPLARMMQGLKVPATKDRTWTYVSDGAFYDGVRMPSAMYSQTADPLLAALIAASRRGGFLIDRMAWSRTRGSLIVVSPYLASDAGDLKSVDRGRGVLRWMSLAGRLTVEQQRMAEQGLTRLEERLVQDRRAAGLPLDKPDMVAIGRKISAEALRMIREITGVSVVVKATWTDQDARIVPGDSVTTHQVNPLAAYLASSDHQTVNQFMLTHTHLQPDLDQVNHFLETESQRIVAQIPDGLTVDQANRYLETREQRLGVPNGTFVRFEARDQAWLTQQLRQVRATVVRDGALRLSAAQSPSVWLAGVLHRRLRWLGISITPERLAQRTEQARRWVMTTTLIAGFKFPLLWGVTAVAWLLGLSPIRTGWATLSRWGQGDYWRRVLQRGSLFEEPYSEEVVFLSRLYGIHQDQAVVRHGRIVDLNSSALDGLYDAASWRLAIGTYLSPGTTIARLPLWERRGLKLHAAPVPFVAALRLLEEPPWTAPASGFNRLPTDAFELGEVFAEDTLFGLVNLHRAALNPTLNASNVHKVNYLQAQQELRKRDDAATRAIQFFKGLGMAQASQHLFDHPMFDAVRQHPEAGVVQRLFGWDPTTQQPSRQSIFGMEAFRRDEVAAAGARGAGTLSYGYSGFTASDLFGRRVGPFAPGDVQAYWTSRFYQVLDGFMGGRVFRAVVDHQARIADTPPMDRDRPTDPSAILQGRLIDPFDAVADAGVRHRRSGLEELPIWLDTTPVSFERIEPIVILRAEGGFGDIAYVVKLVQTLNAKTVVPVVAVVGPPVEQASALERLAVLRRDVPMEFQLWREQDGRLVDETGRPVTGSRPRRPVLIQHFSLVNAEWARDTAERLVPALFAPLYEPSQRGRFHLIGYNEPGSVSGGYLRPASGTYVNLYQTPPAAPGPAAPNSVSTGYLFDPLLRDIIQQLQGQSPTERRQTALAHLAQATARELPPALVEAMKSRSLWATVYTSQGGSPTQLEALVEALRRADRRAVLFTFFGQNPRLPYYPDDFWTPHAALVEGLRRRPDVAFVDVTGQFPSSLGTDAPILIVNLPALSLGTMRRLLGASDLAIASGHSTFVETIGMAAAGVGPSVVVTFPIFQRQWALQQEAFRAIGASDTLEDLAALHRLRFPGAGAMEVGQVAERFARLLQDETSQQRFRRDLGHLGTAAMERSGDPADGNLGNRLFQLLQAADQPAGLEERVTTLGAAATVPPRVLSPVPPALNEAPTVMVVLAAGRGTRMGGTQPKATISVHGKPMARFAVDAARTLGIPVIGVVGSDTEAMRGVFGPDAVLVQPPEGLLGTAAALLAAAVVLQDYHGTVLVALGDMPGVEAETLQTILQAHRESGAAATDLVARVSDPSGLGRVVRTPDGRWRGEIQANDLNRLRQTGQRIVLPDGTTMSADVVAAISEVNTGLYVFRGDGLFAALRQVPNDNPAHEFYLPSVLAVLQRQGAQVAVPVVTDDAVAAGVNTPAERLQAETLLARRTLARPAAAWTTGDWSAALDRASTLLQEAVVRETFVGTEMPLDTFLHAAPAMATPWHLLGLSLLAELRDIYGPDLEQVRAEVGRYQRVLGEFESRMGPGPVRVIRAPGRGVLEGSHNDYNGGAELLMTLPVDTLAAARPRTDTRVRMASTHSEFPETTFDIEQELPPAARGDWSRVLERVGVPPRNWSNYVKGSVLYWQNMYAQESLRGMDLVVDSTLPMERGISSSSALVVVAGIGFHEVNRKPWTPYQIAEGSGPAEWYVGTRGGNLDHAASLLGRRGQVVRVRPGSPDVAAVPLPAGYRLILADSLVPSDKTGTVLQSFNQRSAESRLLGIALLKQRILAQRPELSKAMASVTSLGALADLWPQVSNQPLETLVEALPETVTTDELAQEIPQAIDELRRSYQGLREPAGGWRLRQRVRHVVREIQRVDQATEALQRGDIEALGAVMDASFRSYRDDYQITVPALESLARVAHQVPGVLGVNLQGGGFGGFTLILAKAEAMTPLMDVLMTQYYQPQGLDRTRAMGTALLVATPTRGAGLVEAHPVGAAGLEEAGPGVTRTTATSAAGTVTTTVTVAPAAPAPLVSTTVAMPAISVANEPRQVPVAFQPEEPAWTPRVRQATAVAPAPVVMMPTQASPATTTSTTAAAPATVVTVTPQAQAQMALDVAAAELDLAGQEAITVAAVPVSALVQADPTLAAAAGQIIKFGDARLLIVPDNPAQVADAIVPFMSETKATVVIRTYGGPEEAALNAFETQARRVGFQVEPRRPLTGTTLGELLRQILANLSGLEESAVPAPSVRELVEALTLKALA